MKILVFSDSHGSVENMALITAQERPAHILHLGDCVRDAHALSQHFPDIPLQCVCGNCDLGAAEEAEKLIELGERRILLMHGHTRRVKYGTMNAYYAAREYGADILLFGHTHVPLVDFDGTLYTLNPGSCHLRSGGTYGIIELNGAHTVCRTVSV